MSRGVIALWMYRDSAGDTIQRRLKDELEKAGFSVINDFDMRECHVLNGRVFTDDGFDLSSVDILYHMNADEQTPYQRQILAALDMSGVHVVNSFSSFDKAHDKFTANVLLKNAGLPVAPAMLIHPNVSKTFIKSIFVEWGAIVIKPRYSHGGKGIIQFNDADQFLDFISATKLHTSDYYAEKFLPFSDRDYRIELFNDQYIGSYSRGLVHRYKTNFSYLNHPSEGRFLALEPRDDLIQLAKESARVLGLKTTIVDFVKCDTDQQFYILEVNCQMGIFNVAASAHFGLIPKDANAFEFAGDEIKIRVLVDYLTTFLKEKQDARNAQ